VENRGMEKRADCWGTLKLIKYRRAGDSVLPD